MSQMSPDMCLSCESSASGRALFVGLRDWPAGPGRRGENPRAAVDIPRHQRDGAGGCSLSRKPVTEEERRQVRDVPRIRKDHGAATRCQVNREVGCYMSSLDVCLPAWS